MSLVWSNYFSRGKDDVPPVTLSWSRCTPGPELRDRRLVQPRHRASFQPRNFRCSPGQTCLMGCRSGGRSGTSGPISCPQRRSSSPSLGQTQLAGSQYSPQLVCLVALDTVGLKKFVFTKIERRIPPRKHLGHSLSSKGTLKKPLENCLSLPSWQLYVTSSCSGSSSNIIPRSHT